MSKHPEKTGQAPACPVLAVTCRSRTARRGKPGRSRNRWWCCFPWLSLLSRIETQPATFHYTSMSELAAPPSTLASVLVENHRQFLAFVERRVGDRALAEDILQDAFVKSIEKGEDVREDGSAVAWFYRLLRNAVIDHYRRRDVRAKGLESFAREMHDAVEAPPEIRDAICDCLTRLTPTLKPEYASAIQRLELEGASLEEYAGETGISRNNAAVRAFRARQALRKQVKASCGTCAEHGCLECSCSKKANGASGTSGTNG